MKTLVHQSNDVKVTLHLIANSHLDPVWLWDAHEGLNEAISTVRTMLALMAERPELTYIRGESLIYEEILRHDPDSFREIQRLVKAGRWDVVGGTFLQPDMNLPATATLHKHFELGQSFFKKHFNRQPWVGWSADCFGHTAFLPDILRAHGLRAYAFGRPARGSEPKLFWWESTNGQRVLASNYVTAWYGCERDELPRRLDAYLAAAPAEPVSHIFIPFGLGNHGGGPTRRQLDDIAAWAKAHPEVNVEFSGLHRYFAAVEAELRRNKIQLLVVRGELNFCLRGVYASALRIKTAYRKAEAGVQRLTALSESLPKNLRPAAIELDQLWRQVLFNSFHDILPGTAIERALDEQLQQLGGVQHGIREAERAALLALAAKIKIQVPAPVGDFPCAVPFLVFNPHSQPYHGPLELEAALDYRPVWPYVKNPDQLPVEVRDSGGRKIAFQFVEVEHQFMPNLPWRRRLVLDAKLPACGWEVFTVGWVEGAKPVKISAPHAHADTDGQTISAGKLSVQATVGTTGVKIIFDGKPLLAGGGLGVLTVADAFGPWGGHYEEPEALDCSQVLGVWKTTATKILECGPLRAALWVRFEHSKSRIEFIFRLHRQRPAVDWEARLFFDEPRTRVKLFLPGGDVADFDIPGGVLRRGPSGEVPGGRWARVLDAKGKPRFGFASDCIYNFSSRDGAFTATLVRASRHTLDAPEKDDSVSLHRPVIDNGEFRVRGLIALPAADLPKLALDLEQPPLVMPVPPVKH
ncbi:MAG: glycoside hydrolase family 38 [Verrucomicrobiota bacterium]